MPYEYFSVAVCDRCKNSSKPVPGRDQSMEVLFIEGWVEEEGNSIYRNKLLCPDCNKKYTELKERLADELNEFWEGE
jgi:hypothetical protein